MIDLKDLGITQEKLQELVVDRLCEQFMVEKYFDPAGEEFYDDQSAFAKGIKDLVKKRIDAKIDELASAYVLPQVSNIIENITLQQTNEWGEKRGEPVTFIEYLVQRAEHYLTEHVNYEGKTQKEVGYGWSKSQTRITHLVHKHLQYSIETAMKKAMSDANSQIAKGIEETVKIKLAEISAALKVSVKP